MNELLEKLLKSELLNDESKKELSEAFTKHFEKFSEDQRKKIEEEVKLELTKKYVEDKAALVEAMDTKMDILVEKEFAELRDDIERFRNLEAEYAKKLVESRKEMANAVKQDMSTILEALDAYVEKRLCAEFNELRESIDEVKKEKHGRKILEAIGSEYQKMYPGKSNDVEKELRAKRKQLQQVSESLREAREALNNEQRNKKMKDLIGNLSGSTKEVMEAILSNVPTDKLDEVYGNYIGRVLTEATNRKANKVSEKDDNVLAENKGATKKIEGKVVTGDRKPLYEDINDLTGTKDNNIDKSTLERLRKLSGISQ